MLHNMSYMYKNEAPTLSEKLGTISIHCPTLFHTKMDSAEVDKRVLSAPMLSSAFYSKSTNELQDEQFKVLLSDDDVWYSSQ